MKKITFIGGGSAKFVGELTRDIFTFDSLQDCHICLMDVDQSRAQRAQRLVEKMIGDRNLPAKVSVTTDQRKALEGADYVIVTIMVGGFAAYKSDGLIPKKYGVYITVGDTIGPGGVLRLVRTAPVYAQLAKNCREVANNPWLLNYSNPMSMNTWYLFESGWKRTVGLCHSIQWAYKEIADLLGLSRDGMTYTAGGINHIDFYLTLKHKDRDVYPLLMKKKREILKKHPELLVKFELLEFLGHWPAEGPQHQTEYYPWFRKDAKTAKAYACDTMWGYNVDLNGNKWRVKDTEEKIRGKKPINYERSHEYGAWIIDSIESGTDRLIYGNVMNDGLISNLPARSVVEVPCHIDKNGIQPVRVGAIPQQLAQIMHQHISVHQMAIDGVLAKSREKIRMAIQADPLTGAILTLPKINDMVNEMFVANKEYMKGWR